MTTEKPEVPPERDKNDLAALFAAEYAAWKKRQDARYGANVDTKEISSERRPEADAYGMNGILGLGPG
jgi:hypothetical protein